MCYTVQNFFICTLHLQDSLDAVEELLKKHEDFEKLLLAQEERFTQLNRETQVKLMHIHSY